jgi:hypothetical protein
MYNRSQNNDAYAQIPDYIKDTNYILMNKDGSYETIKLPYGYNVFKATGDLASSAMMGEIELSKIPSRLLGISVNAFSPIGVDTTGLQTLAPTVAKPFVQISENKNFFGGAIYPTENPFEPTPTDASKYYKNVNPFAKSIAQTLNKQTGGTMHESGVIDISPETIEHVVEFQTGGLGKLLMRTATVTDQYLDDDKKVDMNKVPFLRGFYSTPREKSETSIIYKMYHESGNNNFSPLERQRFQKWSKTALDKKDIDAKQYKQIVKTFTANQARLDFDKKHNIQKKENFKEKNLLQESYTSGMTASQIREYLKEDKK